jgi:hypothetical protein
MHCTRVLEVQHPTQRWRGASARAADGPTVLVDFLMVDERAARAGTERAMHRRQLKKIWNRLGLTLPAQLPARLLASADS